MRSSYFFCKINFFWFLFNPSYLRFFFLAHNFNVLPSKMMIRSNSFPIFFVISKYSNHSLHEWINVTLYVFSAIALLNGLNSTTIKMWREQSTPLCVTLGISSLYAYIRLTVLWFGHTIYSWGWGLTSNVSEV